VSTARRELTVAAVGAALAGALALSAGGQPWAEVTIDRPAPLPPLEAVVLGADAAPLVPAAGLVLLAAAVALFAVRGAGRVVVGLLTAVAGGVLAWSGIRAMTGGLDAVAADLPGGGGARSPVVALSAGWPSMALVAGVLGGAAGLLVVLRGRRWPGMGRRYERAGDDASATRAAARPRTDEDRAQAAWQALDRGEDPTADPAADPAADRRAGPGVTG
jgi:uncharacterized membrane protein (TIGR02234 family)